MQPNYGIMELSRNNGIAQYSEQNNRMIFLGDSVCEIHAWKNKSCL